MSGETGPKASWNVQDARDLKQSDLSKVSCLVGQAERESKPLDLKKPSSFPFQNKVGNISRFHQSDHTNLN